MSKNKDEKDLQAKKYTVLGTATAVGLTCLTYAFMVPDVAFLLTVGSAVATTAAGTFGIGLRAGKKDAQKRLEREYEAVNTLLDDAIASMKLDNAHKRAAVFVREFEFDEEKRVLETSYEYDGAVVVKMNWIMTNGNWKPLYVKFHNDGAVRMNYEFSMSLDGLADLTEAMETAKNEVPILWMLRR